MFIKTSQNAFCQKNETFLIFEFTRYEFRLKFFNAIYFFEGWVKYCLPID